MTTGDRFCWRHGCWSMQCSHRRHLGPEDFLTEMRRWINSTQLSRNLQDSTESHNISLKGSRRESPVTEPKSLTVKLSAVTVNLASCNCTLDITQEQQRAIQERLSTLLQQYCEETLTLLLTGGKLSLPTTLDYQEFLRLVESLIPSRHTRISLPKDLDDYPRN